LKWRSDFAQAYVIAVFSTFSLRDQLSFCGPDQEAAAYFEQELACTAQRIVTYLPPASLVWIRREEQARWLAGGRGGGDPGSSED
jgi:hypothetical protein